MRLIKCKKCGEIVEASGAQAYCSSCRKQILQASVIRQVVCRGCGVTFPGYPRSNYCPVCRAKRDLDAQRRFLEAKRAGTTRKIGSVDLCVSCGAEYTVNSSRQRYCPECAQSVVRETVNRQKRDYANARRDDYQTKKLSLRQGRKVCAICGKQFDGRPLSVTCSDDCYKLRRKQLQAISDRKRKNKTQKETNQ
ncbi:MAG: hypothetical protein ACI3YH_03225 [Eubacteriales bacterium]